MYNTNERLLNLEEFVHEIDRDLSDATDVLVQLSDRVERLAKFSEMIMNELDVKIERIEPGYKLVKNKKK